MAKKRATPQAPEVSIDPRIATYAATGRSVRRSICRLVVLAYLVLYLGALLAAAAGALGWFGIQRDALSGLFLVVVGMPWTLAAAFFPEQIQPVVGALAPAVTLFCLWTLCRLPRRDRR